MPGVPAASQLWEYDGLVISTVRRAGCMAHVARDGAIQTIVGLMAADPGARLIPATIRNLRRDGVVCRPPTPPVPHADMALAYMRDHGSPVPPGLVRTVARSPAAGP